MKTKVDNRQLTVCKKYKWLFLVNCQLSIACLLLSSCTPDYTPKPKAYPRVIFPERKYELFNPADCPFKFETPTYSKVAHDSTYFGQALKDDHCWFNVYYPALNGVVNLTYKEIKDTTTLEKLVEDAHTMAFKHTKKADYIDEINILNPHGAGGVLYDLGGDAASNMQFFLTDTHHHFVRGALYFYSQPNADSMAPVLSFVKEDLKHMLSTFEWK